MKQLYIVASVVVLLLCSCGAKSKDSATSADHTCFYDQTPVFAEGDTLTALIREFLQAQTHIDSSQTALYVYDLTAHQTLFAHRDTCLVAPASCVKVLTALTALQRLGMDHRYDSRLSVRGHLRGDTLVGNVSFDMDDDPLFDTFKPFCDALASEGIRNIRGNIFLNLTRSDTLRPHHTAALWDIPYHRTPLLFKGKRYIYRNLTNTLAGSGIHVKSDTTVHASLHNGKLNLNEKYRIIAHSRHWLTDVITPMLIHSSNIKAEALLGHIDKNLDDNLTPTGSGLRAMDSFLIGEIGVNPSDMGYIINDGSGLSPENRLSARLLVALMRYAYHKKSYFNYFLDQALATPGAGERCGSLKSRLARGNCVGRIYCKTGTLVTIGASGLTGYAKAANGHWLAFSILNTDCPVAEARRMQDKFCRLLTTKL